MGSEMCIRDRHDGTVAFDNKAYDSLSTAAGMARKSIIGVTEGRKYPQTNGWTFWQFYDERTGKWEEIDFIRQQYIKSGAQPQREP